MGSESLDVVVGCFIGWGNFLIVTPPGPVIGFGNVGVCDSSVTGCVGCGLVVDVLFVLLLVVDSVDVDPGRTGLVGFCGCGVLEAIRWL